jgi:O-acetylhomoserine/O-acetylserine sulfhydrylase-like pyridoxal-dependent enzyme
VKAAIDDDTRAVFCEAIANPGGYITDVLRPSPPSPTRRACR